MFKSKRQQSHGLRRSLQFHQIPQTHRPISNGGSKTHQWQGNGVASCLFNLNKNRKNCCDVSTRKLESTGRYVTVWQAPSPKSTKISMRRPYAFDRAPLPPYKNSRQRSNVSGKSKDTEQMYHGVEAVSPTPHKLSNDDSMCSTSTSPTPKNGNKS